MNSTWVEEYINLSFGIDKLVQETSDWHLVDCYIGQTGDKTHRGIENPEEMTTMINQLSSSLPLQGFTCERTTFLERQLKALAAIVRLVEGIPNDDFKDEIRQFFDLEMKDVPLTNFQKAKSLYDEALPGTGSLRERYVKWQQINTFEHADKDPLKEVVNEIIKETRSRTKRLFHLPNNEKIDFEYVTDKNYGAANWYLGGYRSRAELNIGRPVNLLSLLPLMCHELYPGHHTEFILKEEFILNQLGYEEQRVCLLNTPTLAIAEGIAEKAFEIIFTYEEAAQWAAEHIYSRLKIDVDGFDLAKLYEASRLSNIDQLSGYAVYMLYSGKTREEVMAFLLNYSLAPEKQLEDTLDYLMKTPFFQIYNLSYLYGKEMVNQFISQGDKTQQFYRLLTEQLCPSQILKEVNA